MSIIDSSLISSIGTIASGTVGYLRYAKLSEESVRTERLKTVYNVSIPPRLPFIMRPTFMIGQTDLLRRIDHSTIGGILGAVLIPAILWKHAGIVNCMPSEQLSQWSYTHSFK